MSSTSASSDPAVLGLRREPSRANLCHLLAKAFSSPLTMDRKNPAQLRETAEGLDPDLRGPALELSRCWAEALMDPEALKRAYARLFLGPFEILAPPYASFYLEPDQRLMGRVSREVESMYEAAGLAPGPGPREVPDHVAVEWEFVYFLTYQYVLSADECWLERRRRFQRCHLERWMPSLVRAIERAGVHPFYDALAAMLGAVLRAAESDRGRI